MMNSISDASTRIPFLHEKNAQPAELVASTSAGIFGGMTDMAVSVTYTGAPIKRAADLKTFLDELKLLLEPMLAVINIAKGTSGNSSADSNGEAADPSDAQASASASQEHPITLKSDNFSPSLWNRKVAELLNPDLTPAQLFQNESEQKKKEHSAFYLRERQRIEYESALRTEMGSQDNFRQYDPYAMP